MPEKLQKARRKSSAKRTAKNAKAGVMDSAAARLRQLRVDRGFRTAREAADYYGWNVNTYTQHENETREVSRKAAQRYATAYHVTIDYLLTGKNSRLQKTDIIAKAELASQPIIILDWLLINSVDTQEEMLKLKSSEFAYVSRRSGVTGAARCVIVEDDSALDTARVHRHSFLPGDELLFDPNQKPKPGDLVVAKHSQITAAAPRVYALRQDPATGVIWPELVAINPAYPSVRMLEGDGSYICGVVKKVIRSV